MFLTMGASSPWLSCPSKHGHVILKNPEQGVRLYPGNSCLRSRQGNGERHRYGGKWSQSKSPLVLNPWIPSASRPALGQSPLGPNSAPAVCHETGSQVSSSGCCVRSVQADGVRAFTGGCASESQGAWSHAHQSLRRTADPVYWLPFMVEETETGVGGSG